MFTNISAMFTAYVIRDCRLDEGDSKHLRNTGELLPKILGTVSQKTVIFILATMRTEI
jgi:hypothetical protein